MTDPPAGPADLEELVLETWEFGDPGGTAERFRELAGAGTDDRAVVLRTQQARAVGLAGDFDAARTVLDGLEPAGPHAAARLAIERGRVLNSTGDPAAAAPLFADARARAVEAGAGGLAVDALHMQAITAGALEGPAAARALDEQALAEIEASSDPQVRRWLGSILNNLGWDLHDSGEPQLALAVFERAVLVREESGDRGAWVAARWCVGRTLRTLGRYDEALALMRELAADPDGAEDDYVHEEIATNLAALG